MKDCRFLQPFEKELQALFPDHEVKWVRDDSNTEYEEIRIDNQMVMTTDVSQFECYGENFGEQKFARHHSIVVYFPFIESGYDFGGLHIEDPYRARISPVRFELFCEHKILRELFPYLMEKNDSVIKKVMCKLCVLDEAQKDFQ